MKRLVISSVVAVCVLCACGHTHITVGIYTESNKRL
jgi:hypothetical protein